MKYLGLYIDNNLDWSFHTSILSSKLSRAAGMLSKIRYYVNKHTLRSIYFAIFSSLLMYASTIWGQKSSKHIKRIETIQNQAIKIINFAPKSNSSNELYFESNILKFTDYVKLNNFLLVHDSLHNKLPSALDNSFTPVSDHHSYYTRGSTHLKMIVPKINKVNSGEFSIGYQGVKFWNQMVGKYPTQQLHLKNNFFCKRFIKQELLQTYK